MYKLTRSILIANVLLCAYCAVLVATMIPWVWLVLGTGVVLCLCKKARRYTAFGTARWADISDMGGMIDE